MNNQAKANFLIALLCIAILLWLLSIGYNDSPKNERQFPDYKNGEILYPDMIHSDTLTVIDADGLNQAAAYWDGSDGEINEALHIHCK